MQLKRSANFNEADLLDNAFLDQSYALSIDPSIEQQDIKEKKAFLDKMIASSDIISEETRNNLQFSCNKIFENVNQTNVKEKFQLVAKLIARVLGRTMQDKIDERIRDLAVARIFKRMDEAHAEFATFIEEHPEHILKESAIKFPSTSWMKEVAKAQIKEVIKPRNIFHTWTVRYGEN